MEVSDEITDYLTSISSSLEQITSLKVLCQEELGDTFTEKVINYYLRFFRMIKYSFPDANIIKRMVSRSISLVVSDACDQYRNTQMISLEGLPMNPEICRYFLLMVQAIDRIKKIHDKSFMPLGLYLHIGRLEVIPEEYLFLKQFFKSKRKNNMVKLLIVSLNDLLEDFEDYHLQVKDLQKKIRKAIKNEIISPKDIISKSYFQVLLESQTFTEDSSDTFDYLGIPYSQA